jgi:hypothetical protein
MEIIAHPGNRAIVIKSGWKRLLAVRGRKQRVEKRLLATQT